MTRGKPHVFRQGHAARYCTNEGFRRAVRLQATGVPVERVQPLVAWLIQRYGNQHRAALATGLSEANLSIWRRGKVVHLTPKQATDLAEVVLAHKRKRSPWSMYEVEAAVLPEVERQAVPDPSTRRNTQTQRLNRKGIHVTKFCPCGNRIGNRSVYDICYPCRRKQHDFELAATNQRRFVSGLQPLVRTG